MKRGHEMIDRQGSVVHPSTEQESWELKAMDLQEKNSVELVR
jgi:hypothetical protein